MTRPKKTSSLNHVLQRLVLLRMFLLFAALSVVVIGALGYLGERSLERRRQQTARYMARFVDQYLDQAIRLLGAAARVAESTPSKNSVFMQGVLEAYSFFDTLYFLDADQKIKLLFPTDPRYMGLDMSNLPFFKQSGQEKDFTISRPFISLRTGNPTVYLSRPLARGDQIVGELNLGSLQDEISQGRDAPDQGMVFILDQFGMLLAHPDAGLVRQQTNRSNLKIFRRGLRKDTTQFYKYAGRMVLGSTARVERVGWVVVDQVPLSVAFGFYAWALGLTLLASLLLWLVLTWSFRRQLQRHVVAPMVQLSQGISALAKGDFSQGKALATLPATFSELWALATDFQQMSDALEARQADLQKSEKRYRSLFERVPTALYRTTPAGQFLDLNLANVRMLGYPDRDTLLKTNAADLYENPEERQQWRTIADSDGIVRDFVMQMKRYDGSVIWVRHTSRAVRDNNGQVLRYEGSLEDITERRQAQESIRKLSQAIEQSPVSIIITNLSGKIEFVNAKFTQITGYAYDEAIGRRPSIFKSGQTPAEEYKQLWQTITSGGVWQGKFQNRKKNGELFWEQATIAPVRNADKVITHYVAVKEDITERVNLEAQLRQTQKMEAVGQLAGGVAHDFNNMLSVITGHAELALERTDLDSNLRKDLQEILKASLRSTDITRQLLAFARKQTIMPKIFDLNEAVEGMLNLLRRLIGEDIDLDWRPGATLWPVKMDPSQFDQILANLCVNARDAIGGVGKISIETGKAVFDETYCSEHKEFSPGEYVMLAVKDNGQGMDEIIREKIFEPFFTTKDVGKGTGLGLSTVYGIISQNEGCIHVFSEPELGTTFKIFLPRQAEPSLPKPEASPEPQDLMGHETILVVEDEIMHLELVELMLKRYGYRVLAASHPNEALQKAKGHAGEIQLLLTDMVMPEMSGRDLSEAVTSLYPGIRCLFMSGYTDDIIVHQGIIEKGVPFIQKPFSVQNLAVKVREILNTRSNRTN